jgi:predicted metalloprotease
MIKAMRVEAPTNNRPTTNFRTVSSNIPSKQANATSNGKAAPAKNKTGAITRCRGFQNRLITANAMHAGVRDAFTARAIGTKGVGPFVTRRWATAVQPMSIPTSSELIVIRVVRVALNMASPRLNVEAITTLAAPCQKHQNTRKIKEEGEKKEEKRKAFKSGALIRVSWTNPYQNRGTNLTKPTFCLWKRGLILTV